MKLDFWNNPIIVSAFRVRYRRGGFTSGLAPYLIGLTALGAGLEYYQDKLTVPWTSIYYPVLMGFQFLMSGVMASAATAGSMRAEVMNRTLDFQRIATLTPRQILVGKLLGEPAIAYLFSMSTFPLAMWCFLAGGVDFEVMILMYVNLATTLLLCGATGLIGRLELPAGQPMGLFLSVWAIGMPIPLFVGLAQHSPWGIAIPLFGVDIPYSLLLPPVQLLMTFVCFRIMERQLISPMNPLLSKPMTYVIGAGMDLVVAALIFGLSQGALKRGLPPAPPEFALGIFWFAHFIVSFLLIMGMTSWRQSIYSWIWRFRRRRPYLVDLWLGDRSVNILAVATFAALGLVSLVAFVIVPAIWMDGWDDVKTAMPNMIALSLTCTVLILTWGTIHQWFVLIGGRSASPFALVLFIVAMTVPWLGALKKETEWIESFSPGVHFAYWLGAPSRPAFSYLIVVGLYFVTFLLFFRLIRRRLRQMEALVDYKLRVMGVLVAGPKKQLQPEKLSKNT